MLLRQLLHARRRSRQVAAMAATCVLASCANSEPTVVLPPVVFALTSATPPIYSEGETTIFQVTTPVAFPIRAPAASETQGLAAAPPYARGPYYSRDDTRISVRFAISNADTEKRTVTLLFDPWNEFAHYEPGLAAGEEDELVPNLSGIERTFVVLPQSRVVGIVTPDDFLELAEDLGTAEALLTRTAAEGDAFGGPVLFNRAMNVQNRDGASDPLLRTFVPKFAIAGVAGVDVSLRTPVASNVSVDLLFEIVDKQGKRVVVPGETVAAIVRPARAIIPPAAPPR